MGSNSEIRDFIKLQNSLSTLKFITCGSVDDGKSTLLGRMLYEAQLIFEDQVDSLVKDSKKVGTQGEDIDFALLVDGLAAEREQGITIDVAYRYFSTEKRKFIVADSPGHEQYTRNMVTAASNAELAIILIDARNGILPQTKRHSFIADLMGIKNIVVAINKMDLVDYSYEIFKNLSDEYVNEIQSKLNFQNVKFIPVSALKGDNIISNSENMSWYHDQPLMNYLETATISHDNASSFSMPIQIVNRPNLNFRGFSGTVSSGNLSVGEIIQVASSGEKAKVKEIFLGDKPINESYVADSVTITLNKEIDISRGDILISENQSLQDSDFFKTSLIWFDQSKCYQNRTYILKTSNRQVNCEIIKIKNKININNYEKINTGNLSMNDIAECEISLSESLQTQTYAENRTLGNFILIDRHTNLTVAAGTFDHPLRRSANVKWEETEVDIDTRRNILGQKSCVLWFTGLSGSGKSTIANILEKKLSSQGKLTYLLDGDNLRHGLNKDLGFKSEDRIENIRRVGEVAKILYDAGVIVLASFISPFASDRARVKELFPDGEFIEIYVNASIDEVKKRDPKGLYKKAEEGQIPNFTGVNSPYEVPENPSIEIKTKDCAPEEAASKIIDYLGSSKCI